MPLVSLRGIVKSYPARHRGAPPVVAVDHVDLDIEAGDVFGIIGYSGAGKSTLVRLINALEPVTTGTITVAGREITGLRERDLRAVRRDIGMIFQQFNLFRSRTVRGNVAYPLRVAGRPKAEVRARVDELLAFVGLSDKADAYPEQLSGGQKQRVGIARALATSPALLLADEATSALDPETTHEILALLRRVNEEFGVTIVVITHEMDVIQSIATRVAVMEGGRIVESGEVFDVFSRPREASTRRFVSTVVAGVPEGDRLAALRERHPGRLVTVSVREQPGAQERVFGELAASDVPFQLVHGGITDIRGRVFGHLTFELTGPDDRIDAALARLGAPVDGVALEITEAPRS